MDFPDYDAIKEIEKDTIRMEVKRCKSHISQLNISAVGYLIIALWSAVNAYVSYSDYGLFFIIPPFVAAACFTFCFVLTLKTKTLVNGLIKSLEKRGEIYKD